ncbi:hypothetical protein PHLGIDRAFT_23558 [Phlebiopsis gigantea 11061_1 CR5-6]|uniref:UBC core domain-containing protein n=1 Tax=Phlebiopsis gigantea (strain 11061_1 CR5-6) TaxID=745531 RepID=A0A0C3S9I4_PHLG1|nr:hypothetical protein PHLGIDRAFT_23558 [Phlebiopsis gigantea 11061_1 CR5-6]
MLGSLVPSPTIDLSSPLRPRQPARAARGTSTSTAPDAALGTLARTTLALEYAALRHAGHCPLGMYVSPTAASLAVWDAVFFVHQGYYTDSVLRFRVVFPASYPAAPPAVQFLTDVFHPLVSQADGAFNLAPRFSPWSPQEHRVFDVLHCVKAAFKKHALDDIRESDCLNREAFRYHDTTSSFAALATQSAMLSQSASALFDRDHPSMAGKGTHGMPFRELAPEQLAAVRAQVGLREWAEPGAKPQ